MGQRIETFSLLAKKYPVIWHYDPIILGERYTIKRHLQIIANLIGLIGDKTEKLVFSFVDFYGSIKKNMQNYNWDPRAPSLDEMMDFSQQLVNLRNNIAPALRLATCAEGVINLAAMNIEKNSCIDPALINMICEKEIYKPKKKHSTGNRETVNDFSHQQKQGDLFGSNASSCDFNRDYEGKMILSEIFEKDKGQRAACQCAPSKDIGSYRNHPCGHRCMYCYARHGLIK